MTAASSSLVNRITMVEVATAGTAAPVAGSTFIHLPAHGTPRADLQQERDGGIETNNRGNSTLSRPTRKSAKISLDLPLLTGTLGLDGAAGDTPPTNFYLQKLFESAFGGVANNNGSGVQADFAGTTLTGGSTTVPEFTSVANLNVGDFVAFGSLYEVRQVMGISSLAVTLDRAITAATVGLVVYGFFNLKMHLDAAASASEKHLYINHEMQGHGDLIGPGRAAVSFDTLSAGSALHVKAEFDASTYAAGLTPDTFTENVFTGVEVVGVGASLAIGGTEVACNLKSLTTGIQYAWHEATTGTEGRDGMRVLGQIDPALTLSRLYAGADWTAYAARTGATIVGSVTVGSTAAAKARGTFAFAMPNAERDVKHAIENQMDKSDLTFVGKDPTSAQRALGMDRCLYVGFAGGVA